ncbi:MAG: carboxylating nicotinate-nucleotide diphosphorylase [Thaumarchaeota archaeon]|nr:carboxylating nicotinate-nucleotide diphosphorylase [Nitrososphaerota archaeon]
MIKMDSRVMHMFETFLEEDYRRGDITTDAVIAKGQTADAEIIAKEDCVVAGLAEVLFFMKQKGLKNEQKVSDGKLVTKGTVVAKVSGDARELLALERVSLNIISHLSGIATATSKAVSIAEKAREGVRIAATRKTTPGLRLLEKKAVMLGGGDPHRVDLQDMVLIKNNHIEVVGSVKKAVLLAKRKVSFSKKIEIEVSSIQDAVEAAKAGADIIMLDNMRPAEIRNAVSELRRQNLREKIEIEASGGINFDNLAHYAKSGADIISMGMLTHSARSIDFSMRFRR